MYKRPKITRQTIKLLAEATHTPEDLLFKVKPLLNKDQVFRTIWSKRTGRPRFPKSLIQKTPRPETIFHYRIERLMAMNLIKYSSLKNPENYWYLRDLCWIL